ncbi:hypothetical protein [Paenibacillus sp. 203]
MPRREPARDWEDADNRSGGSQDSERNGDQCTCALRARRIGFTSEKALTV